MKRDWRRKKIFGIDDALLGAGAGLLGGIVNNLFAGSRQEDAQAANIQSLLMQQQFNAEQAGVTRDWTSGQTEAARTFTNDMSKQSQTFNAGQASANREWLKDMNATQYQRTMDDMRRSGLNPILAYRQGSGGTPSSAPASVSTPSGGGGPGVASATSSAMSSPIAQTFDIVAPAVSTASALQRLSNETKLADAEVRLKEQMTRTDAVRAGELGERAGLSQAETRRLRAQQPEAEATGAKGAIERDVFSSGAGRILYTAGLVGQHSGKALSPVTDLASTFKQRWPDPLTLEETISKRVPGGTATQRIRHYGD